MAFDKQLHILFTDYSRHLLATGEKLADIRWELMRLAGFLRFVSAEGLVWRETFACKQARGQALQKYSTIMSTKGSSARTMQGMATVAEHFFAFAGFAPADTEVGTPHLINEETAVLIGDDPAKILAACSHAQERALVSLLMLVGLKASQCMKLNLEDLQEPGQIVLRGRHRNMVVAIPDSARAAIEEWLEARRAQSVSESDPLFITLSGNRFAQSAVQYHLKTVGYRAGVQLSAEVLRNTFMARFSQGQAVAECAA